MVGFEIANVAFNQQILNSPQFVNKKQAQNSLVIKKPPSVQYNQNDKKSVLMKEKWWILLNKIEVFDYLTSKEQFMQCISLAFESNKAYSISQRVISASEFTVPSDLTVLK